MPPAPPAPQPTRWNAIKLAQSDTVATALSVLAADTTPHISGGGPGDGPDGSDSTVPRVLEAIPRGHKFALTDIRAGEAVFKYGAPIGIATRDIRAGAHVHLHNLEGFAGKEARTETGR